MLIIKERKKERKKDVETETEKKERKKEKNEINWVFLLYNTMDFFSAKGSFLRNPIYFFVAGCHFGPPP